MKLIALLLALVSMLALAACGGGSVEDDTGLNPQARSTAPVRTAVPGEQQ